MRTITILMDSLNRRYLSAYGNEWVKTPNIDRLVEKSVKFNNHFAGSLPCMPARRELWTGRYNFLETPWSPLQPYDICFTHQLQKQKGTYTHLISDHYHYWEVNGTGYELVFDTWEFVRGQEGDPWRPMVVKPNTPEIPDGIGRSSTYGKLYTQDWVNRNFMDSEKDTDYPTVKCFEKAIEFLDINHEADNWHLHLEVFDPHEPFHCPEDYVKLYGDTWDKFYYDWPNYAPVDEEKEGKEAIDHIRKRYAACVTRADRWLGKLLDAMDKNNMWEDTAIVLTTDHGYMLGEHNYWAKNYMFDYEQIAKIPLIIYHPKVSDTPKVINSLTATIDIPLTILEMHEVAPMENVHGKSLMHLLEEDSQHHKWLLYGYFGKDVSITNGEITYTRQPLDDSIVHNHTAMPFDYQCSPDKYHNAEMGKFLTYTNMPVYRLEEKSFKHHNAPNHNLIYNIKEDPNQLSPIEDRKLEDKLTKQMVQMLDEVDAPECQYVRLGLNH